MANYYASSRSNYFKVKDVDAFKKFCNKWGVEYIEHVTEYSRKEGVPDKTDGLVGFLGSDGDDGALPSSAMLTDADTGEEKELTQDDFFYELSTHLEKGQVAILMEAGAEKLRYINGWAIAITDKNKQVVVSLNDIYDLVRRS